MPRSAVVGAMVLLGALLHSRAVAGAILLLAPPLPFGPSLVGGSGEAAAADRLDIATERLQLVFPPSAPAPALWRACHPSCAAADLGSAPSIRFTGAGDAPQTRVTLRDAGPEVALNHAPVAADVSDTSTARGVTFTSEPIDGVRLVRSFEIARRGYDVAIAVHVLGANAGAFMVGRRLALELDAGQAWSPTTASGWLTIGSDLRRLMLADGRVRILGGDARESVPVRAGQWIGFRNRFWTMLARCDDDVTVDLPAGATSSVLLVSDPGALSVRYTVYSGPVEYAALSHAGREPRRLLFSGLWSWLRAASLGALFLLNALIAIVGYPGPAIILLAVAVKLLLLPVTTVARRLQEQVNVTQVRLQPEIDAIKAAYGGEAQTRRLLELYQRQRVHPLYTLKSLVGVLLQLPVFIAVFEMLAENFALNGAPFLGIGDLAQPDGLIPLPVSLPLVGRHLNLLPFVMSGVSLAASARFDSSVLTPTLLRRQRWSLAAMAALFFMLFYAFPAGMVLYWTSTNTLQLAVREVARLRRRWRSRARTVPA